MSKGVTLEDIKRGANEDGDCGYAMDKKPDWLDMNKFKRGQEFFQKHMASLGMSMHFSLVSGFAIVNLLVPLVFTNNSDTPEKAFKRYLQTFYHLFQWLRDPGIWDGPASLAFRSISRVRKMHGNVAMAMNKKMGDRRYVTQYDMALVQAGFMGAIVMYPERFGVYCAEEELEDYVHLWRGLGYLLGIDDKYNICSGNFQQTKNIVKEIERELLIPALADPPKDFDKMSFAYIDGLNLDAGFKAMSRESMLALAYESFGLPVPPLSLDDWLRISWMKFSMWALHWVPGWRWFMNWRLRHHLDRCMTKIFGFHEDYISSYHAF